MLGVLRRRTRLGPLWETVTVTCWFVVFTALATLFPRSGDDWAWAREGGDRLHGFFAGYNGRYAGDLLILGLVHVGWWATPLVAATVCGTLVLALHLAGNRTPLGYALASALFLAMPLGVWRQGVVWLSGFTNYATATVFLLVFLAVLRADWGRGRERFDRRLLVLVPVGFVGQLFMEHVTLCIFLLGLGAVVLLRIRRGHYPLRTALWTSGAVVGTVVMFSNSAYRRALSGSSSYQSTDGSLHDVLVKAFAYVPTNAVVLNTWLDLAVALLAVATVVLTRQWHERTARGVLVLAPAFLVVVAVLRLRTSQPADTGGAGPGATVAALLLVAVLLLTWRVLVRAGAENASVIPLCVVATVLVCGPLLAVNPLGPRCFYPSYVVLITATAAIARSVLAVAPVRVALPALLHVAAAGLTVMMFVVYLDIHHGIEQRLHHIRQAARSGQSEVTIRPLPHSLWVHDAEPYWSGLSYRFKEYYRIRQSLVIRMNPNPWRKSAENPDPPPPP